MRQLMAFLAMLAAVSLTPVTVLFATDGADSGRDAPKSSLVVLYVGPDPDKDPRVPSYIKGADARRMVELTRERMPAFEAFLEEHFETVRLVKAGDYEASLSDQCDVTINGERGVAFRKGVRRASANE